MSNFGNRGNACATDGGNLTIGWPTGSLEDVKSGNATYRSIWMWQCILKNEVMRLYSRHNCIELSDELSNPKRF